MSSQKKPTETAQETALPVLVRHANANGGALYSGGVPGNAGGSGRPPSVVRARARDSFYERIPVLEEIADKARAHDSNRIAAIATLARFGLGGNVSVDDVRERLGATVREVRAFLPPDQAAELLARIGRHWGMSDPVA